jgi:hypothetical protein
MKKFMIVKMFVPYLLFLGFEFFLFPSSGSDDSYITYWSAYSLSEFGQIVNYNGDKIEQSSTLLLTLLLAIFHKITAVDIETLSPLLSLISGIATIYLAGLLSKALDINSFAVKTLTATSIPLLYWGTSGMETSLIAAVVLLLLLTFLRVTEDPTVPGYFLTFSCISAYILLRPEAFFVIELFLFFSFLLHYFRNKSKKTIVILGIYSSVFFIILTLFRYLYFDAFFPQPVYAKIGVSLFTKSLNGYYYYLKSIRQYFVLFFLLIPVAVFIWNILKIKSTKDSYLYLFILSYLLFIFSSGGDWMIGLRFFVPVIPLLIVTTIIFFSSFLSVNSILSIGVVANLCCIGVFSVMANISCAIWNYDEYISRLKENNFDTSRLSFFEIANKRHYRDIPLSNHLKLVLDSISNVKKDPSIMSAQGGFVCYHLSREYYNKFTFIDRFGLVTRDFNQCPATKDAPRESFGTNLSYDYLLGNAESLLKDCNIKKPDIIFDLNHINWKTKEMVDVLKYDYKIIFLQQGELDYGDWMRGYPLNGQQFIAVANELFEKLTIEKQTYHF